MVIDDSACKTVVGACTCDATEFNFCLIVGHKNFTCGLCDDEFEPGAILVYCPTCEGASCVGCATEMIRQTVDEVGPKTLS